jgi:hypothetical protein
VVDFWINGEKRWLIEFTVDLTFSNFTTNYKQRLEQSWDILEPRKKVLVDFRDSPPPQQLADLDYYCSVVFTDDFRRAKMQWVKEGVSVSIFLGQNREEVE